MRIAFLGANSQIARDLIRSLAPEPDIELELFVRRPAELAGWLSRVLPNRRYAAADYGSFGRDGGYDAIVNFVGSGNPAHTAALGAGIFDVTQQFDELALTYLREHPGCRYVFFSSGAAYGGDFASPAGDETLAKIPLNDLQPSDWYGAAKLLAECRHRALAPLAIVDLRVFNYFSHTQDIGTRFLISDMLRAILSGETLQTSNENIVRDYLGPQDMSRLLRAVLAAPPLNVPIDCYTQAPVDKMTMLAAMHERFGLQYELIGAPTGFTATGNKKNYYSTSRRARQLFQYTPAASALEVVVGETQLLLPASWWRR